MGADVSKEYWGESSLYHMTYLCMEMAAKGKRTKWRNQTLVLGALEQAGHWSARKSPTLPRWPILIYSQNQSKHAFILYFLVIHFCDSSRGRKRRTGDFHGAQYCGRPSFRPEGKPVSKAKQKPIQAKGIIQYLKTSCQSPSNNLWRGHHIKDLAGSVARRLWSTGADSSPSICNGHFIPAPTVLHWLHLLYQACSEACKNCTAVILQIPESTVLVSTAPNKPTFQFKQIPHLLCSYFLEFCSTVLFVLAGKLPTQWQVQGQPGLLWITQGKTH